MNVELAFVKGVSHMLSRKFFLLLIAFAVALITIVGARQGQDRSQALRDKALQDAQKRLEKADKQLPIADFTSPESDNPEERAKRQAKGKKYNKGLNPLNAATIEDVQHYEWPEGFPSLPVSQSNAIVVGVVSHAKAFLSKDKSNVYSEFSVCINQVLKDDIRAPLMPGSIITTERAGGRVRFPTGEITRVYFDGLGMPLIGKRYVLFLTRKDEEQDFSILTGYELSSDQVTPLDSSTTTNFNTYKNWDETAFLNELRNTITNPSAQKNKVAWRQR